VYINIDADGWLIEKVATPSIVSPSAVVKFNITESLKEPASSLKTKVCPAVRVLLFGSVIVEVDVILHAR